MGGSVNVFLRDHDGTFHKMHRWTNSLPYFNFIGHIENEREHIQDYMSAWLDMKADWENNGPIGPFKELMTDTYFPSPTKICNDEYGLVFVDCITKRILSYQKYSIIGQICNASISCVLHEVEGNKQYKEWYMEMLRKIVSRDALTMIFLENDVRTERPVTSFETIFKHDDRFILYRIDNSPWKITNGDKNERKIKDIKKEIDRILLS